MSSTDRQNGLLVNQDWKTIYQSFRNANFQSYDFDTLKRTMINYIRQNYPEDFNDYIESSEYLALIDLIAMLGQNLAFRGDLAARENFLETAERRESVLRLASLISYNPKRNQCASGLMRLESVKTSERVVDSNGINLANVTISWNDRTNPNYFEQITKIMNAAMLPGNGFGDPVVYQTISGTVAEQYRINSLNTRPPVFPFTQNIDGLGNNFEIVSTALLNGSIVEEAPLPGNPLSFLYRNDGQGPNSPNTGFFLMFKQGTLRSSTVTIETQIKNQIISVDTPNINDSDVWLYNIDTNGVETEIWNKLESVKGINPIYNNAFGINNNVYSVSSRSDDRVSLLFSDGVYGTIPSGSLRVYYRTSINRNVAITPGTISNVSIDIPYLSKSNTQEVLTMTLTLRNVISNSIASETNDQIKQRAPANYYTQNRLVTGEDYNVGLLSLGQDILKTKVVNRISSGISRYYELTDPSGRSSSTNLYGSDGALYKESLNNYDSFSFETRSDVEGIIYNKIEPILGKNNVRNFYISSYGKIDTTSLSAVWQASTNETNLGTGSLSDSTTLSVGPSVDGPLSFVTVGAHCKFVPPVIGGVQYYFTKDNELTSNSALRGNKNYIWAKIIKVENNGLLLTTNGVGPISLNESLPSGAKLSEIIPTFNTKLTANTKTQIIDAIFSYQSFGLRYDQSSSSWQLILEKDLNTDDDFSIGNIGDTSGGNLDSSWILYFRANDDSYDLIYRTLRYVFESQAEIRFSVDRSLANFDTKVGRTVKDSVSVLPINTQPNTNDPLMQEYKWSIVRAYTDEYGIINNKIIEIDFFDADTDGVVDNPDSFLDIVDEGVNYLSKLIFKKLTVTQGGIREYSLIDRESTEIIPIQREADIGPLSQYTDGQVFFIADRGIFKKINKLVNTVTTISGYKAFVGRQGLKFYYKHVSDSGHRIDPASSNLMDAFILTRSYDIEMRRFVTGGTGTMPLPPTSDELFRKYNDEIRKKKAISDDVVYHPVKYKLLFGNTASEELQVKFEVIRNPNVTISDNQIRSLVIAAINRFFSIEFWNFGDTFYFQELSAYVMNQISPNIVSFMMVPKQQSQTVNSLMEIKSNPNEIFISVASASDISIVDQISVINM